MKPILFVDSAEALGGAERSLLFLMQYLDRERFTPILACNESPLAEEVRTAGLDVTIVPMPRLRDISMAPVALLRGARMLVDVIRGRDVAIVHSNVMRASFYAASAARWTGRPFIWHVRDIHTEAWYLRLMCVLAHRAIAISQAVATPIPCSDKVAVIYNGLVLDDFNPAPDRSEICKEFHLPPDVPVVGTVGRVRPWKRHDLFVRMAALVNRSLPDAHYAVVGDTVFPAGHDYLGELRALALDLGLIDRVVFPGFRSDIAQVLATLDVVVHTADAEPFGRVLIEAMAVGRPVVAFANGGVPEIVIDGVTGFLVRPGDIEGMADAVISLLTDPDRRHAMGTAGRRRVEAHFDARQTARAVEAVYEEVLARR